MARAAEQNSGVSRRWMVTAAGAAAAGAGLWWQRRQPAPHDQPRLSVAQAFAAVQEGSLVLVDIRTPQEWRRTGVPSGSHQIDMRRADFAETLLAVLDGERSAPVALICARGVRSARMARALAADRFVNVADVPEGMLGSAEGAGWIAANLPVARWQG